MSSSPSSEFVENYQIRTSTEQRSKHMVPPTPRRSKTKSIDRPFSRMDLVPRPLYYRKPAKLSRLYSARSGVTYLDQVFEQFDKLGEGSFGTVYRVRSHVDARIYAVKKFRETTGVRYGRAEVRNMEKVGNHPNCVRLFMAWEELRTVYIQMEFCQTSLAQYADRMVTLAEPQLWEILIDMLAALKYLYTRHFIHLDVKPANIMISQGRYKLGDFGLIVDMTQKEESRISAISEGDAKYLASEVLHGIYTYSCDVFSLGISIVELATNIVLPEFGTLWHHIRSGQLPLLFYQSVNEEMAYVVKRMMMHSHEERPNADQLLRMQIVKQAIRVDREKERLDYARDIIPVLPAAENNNRRRRINNENELAPTFLLSYINGVQQRMSFPVRNSCSRRLIMGEGVRSHTDWGDDCGISTHQLLAYD